MKKLNLILILLFSIFIFNSCKKNDIAEDKTTTTTYKGVKSQDELSSLLQQNNTPFNKLSLEMKNSIIKNSVFDDHQVFHGFSGNCDLTTELKNIEIVDFYTKVCGEPMTILDEKGNNILGASKTDAFGGGTTYPGWRWKGGNDCTWCGSGCSCVRY